MLRVAGDSLRFPPLAPRKGIAQENSMGKHWPAEKFWRSDAVTYLRGNFINPYPTAFPYGNGMVLYFYQQQESSTTKTVHKVINKGLKAYV